MTPNTQELNHDQWIELVSKLSYPQMHDLRTHINERMKIMRQTGVEQMRLKFIEDAAALGLAPEDIFGTTDTKRRKPAAPKYRDEHGNTWTGRGKRPKWLV